MNIRDIAERAGVSTATVSRVINGGSVKARTAEKVRQIMADEGFTPNVFARSLQWNSMKVLSMLTVDISDVYFAAAMLEVEKHAQSRGYEVQVGFATDDPEDQLRRLRKLVEKKVDGIIVAGSAFVRGDVTPIVQAAKNCPVVLLNGRVDEPGVYSVLCDDGLGIQRAVTHLAELGRQRLVYLGDDHNVASAAKERGFVQAVQRRSWEPHVVRVAIGLHAGYAACDRLLAEKVPFDALVCSEDLTAVGAIRRLREEGLRVPDDVAVTGYDNLAFARTSDPELTSVDGHVDIMARTCAELVIEAAEGRDVPTLSTVVPDLVVRGSTVG